MSEQRQATSAVVVAGGASRRLGSDKRRLKLWGEGGPTLLEHTVRIAHALCDDVVVVLNDMSAWPQLDARLVADAYPGGGALGGIATGLAAAQYPYALVVAADMPFLNPELLAAMLEKPRNYDILVPRTGQVPVRNRRGVEPLHAIYARRCLPAMQAALGRGELRIAALYDELRVSYLETGEVRAYDPAGLALLSINTPEDESTARRVLAAQAH